MKYKLSIILILYIFMYPAAEAKVMWVGSLDSAQLLAFQEGKLILAALDKTPDLILENESLQKEIEDRFIPFKAKEGEYASPYMINADGIVILDAFGNVIMDTEEKLSPEDLNKILKSFPKNVSKLNLSLAKYSENINSPELSYDIAVQYQNLTEIAQINGNLCSSYSNEYFIKSLKLARKEKNKLLEKRSRLMIGLNCIINGEVDKGISMIKKKVGIDELDLNNLALAYYILARGYSEKGEVPQAYFYIDRLRLVPGGFEYLVKLTGERKYPAYYEQLYSYY